MTISLVMPDSTLAAGGVNNRPVAASTAKRLLLAPSKKVWLYSRNCSQKIINISNNSGQFLINILNSRSAALSPFWKKLDAGDAHLEDWKLFGTGFLFLAITFFVLLA